MPITLNGNFYTSKELADEIGINYRTLFPIIKSKEGVITVGQTFLIPEALGKLIIKELNYKEFKATTAPTMLAKRLGIQAQSMEKIISYGLPTVAFNEKKRLRNNCIPFLTQAIKEIVDKNGRFPIEEAYTCYLRTMELMEQSKND